MSATAGISGGSSLDIQNLTRRMRAGDEAAYRTFYDAYYDRLSRYLLVVTRGDEEAMREALQATLIRVARHVRVFETEAVFWSWLTVLARSAVTDEGRKRRSYFAFLDRFTRFANRPNQSAEAEEAEADLRALLEQGIRALSDDDQQLVRWKYHEGRSVREIAADLGETEKTIESRLTRVRQKVKAQVQTRLKDEARH